MITDVRLPASRPASPYQALYGLRIVHLLNGSVYWLDGGAPLSQISDRVDILRTTSSSEDWRCELRIRCVPQDLHDLYEKDKATLVFYYDQVR